MAIFNLPLNCQAADSALPPHFSFHVDTGRVSDKLFFIFYYVRVCLRCVVRRAPPQQGKKAVPGSERDPTRCHPDRQGKGGEGGGGGVRKARREGLRQKGRKKMVEQREEEGVTEDDVFYSCLGCVR